MIVIDAHNDTLDRRLSRGDTLDLTRDAPHLDTDLARLRAGGITALFQQVGILTLATSLKLLDAIHTLCTAHPQDFLLVSNAEDIRQAEASGRIGIVAQIESLTCLEGNLAALRLMHKLGVRVAGLTHGEAPDHALQHDKSPWGYCTQTDRDAAQRIFTGLTPLGCEAIRELNHLRIVIDLAHANDATFYQALERSDAPCIFSHGNAFALCPNWRNLTDDQIRALSDKGGVMGVAGYRKFINEESANVERLADHVEHIAELVGINHVGLGMDWDGLGDDEVAIPKDPAHLQELIEALKRRGFGEADLARFLGLNWLRVFEQVVG